MLSILSCFALSSEPVSCAAYGNGHINGTRLVTCQNGARYILQQINTGVFREPVLLMRNIELVTAHLRSKSADPRGVLTLVPTLDGASFAVENGEYWRVYEMVPGSVCFDQADETLFYESAVAFGRFQNELSDFPAEQLCETIPHFHDTPARFAAFEAAALANASGRRSEVEPEIDFVRAREAFTHTLVDLQSRGELPLRVTHNDTKINNVLFDAKTRKALCVIDLDTVMPGLAVNDFGDAIRYGASTAADWPRASVTELADHIISTHHTFTRAKLARIDELLARVQRAHAAAHGALLEQVRGIFDGLRAELEPHLDKEEQVLFPAIRAIDGYLAGRNAWPVIHCGSLVNPIRQMEAEHDSAGAALARLRELTSSYQAPDDACPTFHALYEALPALESDLHEHIHLENNILFPRSVEQEERMT